MRFVKVLMGLRYTSTPSTSTMQSPIRTCPDVWAGAPILKHAHKQCPSGVASEHNPHPHLLLTRGCTLERDLDQRAARVRPPVEPHAQRGAGQAQDQLPHVIDRHPKHIPPIDLTQAVPRLN
eukprot:CAMPEP_0206240300 /NCGR_PEP_ID=MMETSP0047_2-20121206/15863_1 /ASSEMBLY_ACC=CAM_ASM_000192 /TAXON_ID=195065 /ORGANISM="Chroomonas mesostigmatica_cf, Strain CCMP1168" /LENGTH=121 /DNA_ID=CAMNT_0053665069 /DNA_START=78 /DNA_END=439 /DNA_ORIENTATION=+